MPRPPRPYKTLRRGKARYSFFLGDCTELLANWPAGSVDVAVTSPPYNLGIAYNTFRDTMPRPEYLKWTSAWVQALARVLSPDGSLFLNVGSKPTDPWLAMDVAQAARRHLQLQNTIHWIKSIAIEKALAGARARARRGPGRRPLQADQQSTICP